MDIKSFIEIISKETGKTFIVDPRVKGKITVVSSKPMDEQQIYDVFLSILSVHGFTAIPSGSIIKVIPENLAKSQDSPVLPIDKPPVDGSSFITQIIEIKHISAAQLIPLLRPLIRQQGHLVAYPNNNNLVIYDNANNVNRLLKIISRIDKPTDEDIEMLVLEHATAVEIVRVISNLEHDKTKTTNIIADTRTNTVLISGSKATRLRLRTIVTHLDTPMQNTGNTKVIYLRYAQAKDLVGILKGINSSNEKLDKLTAEANTVNIQADENTNSLIITATPKELQNIQSVIRQLDIRRAQVLVEAVIAEVSSDMVRELGVQWWLYGDKGTRPIGAANFDNIGSKISDLAASSYQGSSNIPTIGIGSSLGIGTFTDSGLLNFGLLLQALDADTDTNVLSTPSLLTLDNQEAEIVVGQNVPFVTGQYTNSGSANNVGNPFQTIQREDVGIKLKVRPQINEGNTVKLEIEQEVSSISRSSSASDIVTNKRNIKTTVIVEDNNMIVLGGLIDEELQQTIKKVPGLGDMPIIGGLFRSKSTKKVKRNLMVFLRPTIVRDTDSENIISSDKYSYMRIKQLEQKLKQPNLADMEKIPILPDLDDFLTILPGKVDFME
ncbi:MAG: type II secretion system secretin GspD [Candidatus Marithrix sp.]|nr:type II secretion system secretin GspD [Candidatus Marithrix sp.]